MLKINSRLKDSPASLQSAAAWEVASRAEGNTWIWEQPLEGLDLKRFALTSFGSEGERKKVRIAYTTADLKNFEYKIELLKHTEGVCKKTSFICPSLLPTGESCSRRCRQLILCPKDQRFACLRCAGVNYLANVASRNLMHQRFWRHIESLDRLAVPFLKAGTRRREKLRQRYVAQFEQIEKFIRDFLHPLALRFQIGCSTRRDEGYFSELAEFFLREDHDSTALLGKEHGPRMQRFADCALIAQEIRSYTASPEDSAVSCLQDKGEFLAPPTSPLSGIESLKVIVAAETVDMPDVAGLFREPEAS